MDSDAVIAADNASAALMPVREQTVQFYGDSIPAAQLADGEVMVPLRPICDFLGLTWRAQRMRLQRDPVLAPEYRTILLNTPGGPQRMLALRIDMLPGWLSGVSVNKVRPELRDKILRYQRECFRVLWDAFKEDILSAQPPPPPDLSPAEQALLLAEAVASLARQHLEMEQRQHTMADYVRGYIHETRRHQRQTDERLTALELQLSSGATISEAQAAEIQLAVKNVAMLLTTHGDVNGFGRVWGDVYRRFRIGAYRNLPAARFEEALTWLRGWYDELSEKG